jgi:hypothetical protein
MIQRENNTSDYKPANLLTRQTRLITLKLNYKMSLGIYESNVMVVLTFHYYYCWESFKIYVYGDT